MNKFERKDVIWGGACTILGIAVLLLSIDKYKNHKHIRMLQENIVVLAQERDDTEKELAKERFYNRRHQNSY